MTSEDPSYWLNRDFLSSARGSYSHQCLVRRQGYLIHPTITSATNLCPNNTKQRDIQPPIQIADIGTGNGIWALETCASLDSGILPYQMTALDISTAMFPPEQTWPKHCIFDTWDIFDEVPEQYIGKFDIVHARFLFSALVFKPTEERERAVRNMTRLVKPGGWFQWQEPCPPVFAEINFHEDGSCSFRDRVPAPSAAIAKYLPATQDPWVHRIGNLVKDVAGFEQVESYYLPPKREFLKFEADLFAWNWSETRQGFKRVGALSDETLEQVQGVWEKFAADLKKGTTSVAMTTIAIVGRKPLGVVVQL